ncbi:MAG TPA: hypothetical protein PLQ32_12080, partial [Flavihumibacter sp.]|nr:hypothetical protein [Flavihumibacter sp.]
AADQAKIAASPYLAGEPYRSRVIHYLQEKAAASAAFRNDPTYQAMLSTKDSAAMAAIFEGINKRQVNHLLFEEFTNQLRQIKTPEEMELLRKAIDISSLAHVEAMKAV